VLYKLPRVVIGENPSFMGEEQWLADHGVQLEVRNDAQCVSLMRDFMERYPKL
jgi:creatinine deaminase